MGYLGPLPRFGADLPGGAQRRLESVRVGRIVDAGAYAEIRTLGAPLIPLLLGSEVMSAKTR